MNANVNYSGVFGNTGPSPLQSAMQGYQAGLALRQQREKERTIVQQQQQALQMQQELTSLAENPNATGRDYSQMMLKYPQLSKHVKESWDVLSQEQQRNKLSDLSQIYSALLNNSPEIAIKQLEEQKQGALNAGLEDEANQADIMIKQIQLNPKAGKTSVGLGLSAIMGPEKFIETFEKLGKTSQELDLTGLTSDQKTEATKWVNQLQTRKSYKDAEDAYLSASQVQELLSSKKPNPTSDMAALVKLSRAVLGGGVLTDRDIDRFGGSQALLSKFQRVIKKAKDGTILDKDKKFIKDTAMLLQKRGIENMDKFLTAQKKVFSNIQGVDDERAEQIINPFRLKLINFDTKKEPLTFSSEEEVREAKLPVGTIIMINGRRAKVSP